MLQLQRSESQLENKSIRKQQLTNGSLSVTNSTFVTSPSSIPNSIMFTADIFDINTKMTVQQSLVVDAYTHHLISKSYLEGAQAKQAMLGEVAAAKKIKIPKIYLKNMIPSSAKGLIITDLIIDNIVQAKENKEAEIVRKRVAAEKRKNEQILKHIQDIKNWNAFVETQPTWTHLKKDVLKSVFKKLFP